MTWMKSNCWSSWVFKIEGVVGGSSLVWSIEKRSEKILYGKRRCKNRNYLDCSSNHLPHSASHSEQQIWTCGGVGFDTEFQGIVSLVTLMTNITCRQMRRSFKTWIQDIFCCWMSPVFGLRQIARRYLLRSSVLTCMRTINWFSFSTSFTIFST